MIWMKNTMDIVAGEAERWIQDLSVFEQNKLRRFIGHCHKAAEVLEEK